jgi:hypothetical protein
MLIGRCAWAIPGAGSRRFSGWLKLSDDTEPHLSVGGPTGTVRSFMASSREVKPRNDH